MEHYLDNSATTRVYPAAAQKALELMIENYGNPSSLHSMGIRAEEVLEASRHTIARALWAEDEEVFFTSGGTEGNNLAIFGAVSALKRRGNKIVTTAAEHSSVLEAMKRLEEQGFEVVYIKPDGSGNINPSDFESAVDSRTILVSTMAVNNETGAVFPVDSIKKIIDSRGSPALFHCDCVQGFMKVPFKPQKIGVDLATVSGHKVHAPKGVGALYIRRGVRIKPLCCGGEQEGKIRPGTQPLPLIGAFACAVEQTDIGKNRCAVQELNRYTREKLSELEGVVINSPENALPYIINFSLKGIRSETMLHFLANRGVYISSGSACAKGKPSHVLQAMGMDRALADSALRVSFSFDNTKADVDALIDGIREGFNTLVKR